MTKQRDHYIDFLRAVGLILLIGVHVDAPNWYVLFRSFDVPLMVFVSVLCYKPLRGGYLAYAKKRFVRLYKPVFIFLTIFFIAETASYILLGKPSLNYMQIIGSYLLLNAPSIGYVWIMRIFILMALAIPFWYRLCQRANWIQVSLLTLSLILIQPVIVWGISLVELKALRFVLNETLPYFVGYSAIAIPAFKIRALNNRQIFITLGVLASVIILICVQNGSVSPQHYKYPPQSLYILYGLFCSIGLWSLKDAIGNSSLISSRAVTYLSTNSMWIYLWHIIPVYAIGAIGSLHGNLMWPVRFLIVLTTSLLLTFAYSQLINRLPYRLSAVIK